MVNISYKIPHATKRKGSTLLLQQNSLQCLYYVSIRDLESFFLSNIQIFLIDNPYSCVNKNMQCN